MALRLAREEGLFAGTSTGGNVAGALRVAEELGPDVTVVTFDARYRDEVSRQVRAGLDGLTVIAAGASRSRVKDCMTEGDPDAGESREAGVTAPPG
ncbi:MAG TPA: hypothetical protein VD833_19835 [Vicinamibacterales bacterium]|nr:hypothetical protein [Vicinamibacterales bacterium]